MVDVSNMKPTRVKTISEFHRLRGLPGPEHPSVSVVNIETIRHAQDQNPDNYVFDFYMISIKKASNIKYRYGQQEYDFDYSGGVMFFMAPNQVFGFETGDRPVIQSGWILLIHPDFLWNTQLVKTINKYEYFDYSVNEALFLSEKEQDIITGLMRSIQQETQSNIDDFSQDIIISQIETLLNYGERFYHRQFITRKIINHKILTRLEDLLTGYFNSDDLMKKGLPSVRYIAAMLNVTPNYLSGLLKVLTGQSTQQHIHNKLIEKAKEQLSTTDLSVGEISRMLGFEHPQSFNKLFKKKTNLSPLEFRESFN